MKVLLILLVLMTTMANAQSPSPTVSTLKDEFARGKTLLLAYIDAMPEEKFNYKPSENSRSFAEQMLHIAQGTAGLAGNATDAERLFNENLEKNTAYQTKAEVKRLVTEALDYAMIQVMNLESKKMDEVITKGQFSVTRADWLQKSFEHMVHHRGQCAVYLRMAGVTPPAYNLF